MKKTSGNRILFLINLNANNGKSLENWHKIRPVVLSKLPKESVSFEKTSIELTDDLIEEFLIINKINCLISVGGDGTLNHLLNTIFGSDRLNSKRLSIGAIGLGSSNDFHKPVENYISGFPTRINFNRIVKSDLGKVSFVNQEGEVKSRYFIINASLGVTAEANSFFNSGDNLLNFLKRNATSLAIIYAAIKTILKFKNYSAIISSKNRKRKMDISNMGVIKIPFVSGDFRYDQSIKPDDGKLGLNYCYNMSRLELLRTLIDLAKGKFKGHQKRVSLFVESLRVETKKMVALETDGEVYHGTDFKFSLIPEAINTLCA